MKLNNIIVTTVGGLLTFYGFVGLLGAERATYAVLVIVGAIFMFLSVLTPKTQVVSEEDSTPEPTLPPSATSSVVDIPVEAQNFETVTPVTEYRM